MITFAEPVVIKREHSDTPYWGHGQWVEFKCDAKLYPKGVYLAPGEVEELYVEPNPIQDL